MSDNTYTVLRDEYVYGRYEEADGYSNGGSFAGTGTIVTRIDGDLAERVRVRSGKTGEVTITEDHWDMDSGNCVTCSMEWMNFTVEVGGEVVYESSAGSTFANDPGAENITSISEFNDWLNGKDN